MVNLAHWDGWTFRLVSSSVHIASLRLASRRLDRFALGSADREPTMAWLGTSRCFLGPWSLSRFSSSIRSRAGRPDQGPLLISVRA